MCGRKSCCCGAVMLFMFVDSWWFCALETWDTKCLGIAWNGCRSCGGVVWSLLLLTDATEVSLHHSYQCAFGPSSDSVFVVICTEHVWWQVLKSNCVPLLVLTAHGLGADMGMGVGWGGVVDYCFSCALLSHTPAPKTLVNMFTS